ncbi:MAG: hypothetical protein K8R25_01470, partial [Methanosarcinales archaeon]|nr:hypothetical protein [Methanosarcinales archaeon]
MEIKLPNDFGNIEFDSWSVRSIESPFDLNAEDFLKFAEEDIEGIEAKDRINALGNIKRAIENRVDLLHYAFGFRNVRENGDFPTKLERLNELNIVAPRILRKINKIRNLLEHQYKLPDKEEIEDAVDIGILFIEYSNKFIYKFMEEFNGIYDDNGVSSISFKEGKIKVIYWDQYRFGAQKIYSKYPVTLVK